MNKDKEKNNQAEPQVLNLEEEKNKQKLLQKKKKKPYCRLCCHFLAFCL